MRTRRNGLLRLLVLSSVACAGACGVMEEGELDDVLIENVADEALDLGDEVLDDWSKADEEPADDDADRTAYAVGLRPGNKVHVCRTGYGLRQRSGPGSQYRIKRVVRPRTRGTVLAVKRKWIRWRTVRGGRGWSHRYYLCRGWPSAPSAQNPVPGYRITTPFGVRGSWSAGYHTGDDYAAPTGANVVATRGGVVKAVSWSYWGGAYGLHVVIDSGGVRHLYAHLSSAVARVGAHVGQGTRIGKVGNTGNSRGSHLHYEERVSPYGYYNHRKPQLNR